MLSLHKQIREDPIQHLGRERPGLLRGELGEVEEFLVDGVDTREELSEEGDTGRKALGRYPMSLRLNRQGLINIRRYSSILQADHLVQNHIHDSVTRSVPLVMTWKSIESGLGVHGHNRWPSNVKNPGPTVTQRVEGSTFSSRVNVELVSELHGFHKTGGVSNLIVPVNPIQHQQRIHNETILMVFEVLSNPSTAVR